MLLSLIHRLPLVTDTSTKLSQLYFIYLELEVYVYIDILVSTTVDKQTCNGVTIAW